MNKLRKFSSELEIDRFETDDNEAYFEGYFIKYDNPAPVPGTEYFEMVSRDAFSNLEQKDIRCLYNHDTSLVLGRTSNSTLVLENREDGLYGKCLVNKNDSDAKNIYERVKRGDISGCSFGAYINNEKFDKDKRLFTLTDVDLIEISVCPFPFYEDTTMEARSKLITKSKIESLKKEFITRRGKRRWH